MRKTYLLARLTVPRVRGSKFSSTLFGDGGLVNNSAWLSFLAGIDDKIVGADMGIGAVSGKLPDCVAGDGTFFGKRAGHYQR